MSTNAYESMTLAQNNKCIICNKSPEEAAGYRQKKRLSVDHDHTTGIVRGLLCNNCNLMVGYAQDDPEILRKAIAYLESHLSERTAA